MARSNIVIGIDLGTDLAKVVALEFIRGEEAPRVVGTGSAKTNGLRKGVVIDPLVAAASLRSAIDMLAQSSGVRAHHAFAGIGGLGLNYQKSRGLVAISRADGEVSKEDIRRAIAASEASLTRVQNRELLHHIPLLYRIDNEMFTHDPLGLMGTKLESETMFIVAYAQHLKGLIRVFDEADIDVDEVFASPFALSYAALSKREKEVGAMMLDIGASTTSLILFEEGLPYSLEVLPIGSAHISNDIAVGFQLNLDEAEKIKLSHGAVMSASQSFNRKDDVIYGKYSKKKLSEIIEARLGDIFELVEKHLKKVGRTGLLPAGVVVAGGGANLPGIVEYARDYLKLPARLSGPANLGGFKEKVRDPLWATAVGVALTVFEEGKLPTYFLKGRTSTFAKWLRAFLP